MSLSQRLAIEGRAKRMSECKCRCRHDAPTLGCSRFRGPPSQRATCSRTGVCRIRTRCCATVRISAGSSVTLLRCHWEEIRGLHSGTRFRHHGITGLSANFKANFLHGRLDGGCLERASNLCHSPLRVSEFENSSLTDNVATARIFGTG